MNKLLRLKTFIKMPRTSKNFILLFCRTVLQTDLNGFIKPQGLYVLSSRRSHNEYNEPKNNAKLLFAAIGTSCVSYGLYKYMGIYIMI